MRKEISERVERAIKDRVFPGCVIGVVRSDGERTIYPFGHFTYDTGSPRVEKHTIYDVASITKSIPTASLALLLMDERRLRLSDPVRKFLPELRNDRGATIKDLLTYSVRGLQLSTLQDRTPEEVLAHVFECGFFEPPQRTYYTNLPALLLGLIIERITGEKLDALARAYFFEPLHMHRSTFFPKELSDVVPTELDTGKEVRALPHDESARIFAKRGMAVGHAGLFSTASDLMNFLEALLTRNYMFAKPILRGAEAGLGWQVNEPNFMGGHASAKTFGKTGFTGTSLACDTSRGIGLVILSNRTYPKRGADDSAINQFRRDIADIVLPGV